MVGDVPAENAVCEFECRKLQCNEGEWANCSRRTRYLAKL